MDLVPYQSNSISVKFRDFLQVPLRKHNQLVKSFICPNCFKETFLPQHRKMFKCPMCGFKVVDEGRLPGIVTAIECPECRSFRSFSLKHGEFVCLECKYRFTPKILEQREENYERQKQALKIKTEEVLGDGLIRKKVI
jgi:DNA-directed RNA polymerase subunit RPC12/RpoP